MFSFDLKNPRNRLTLGLILLLLVVIIWVGSSYVIQAILTGQDDFNNSYFLTFFNTGLFTVYLLYYPCWRRKTKFRKEKLIFSSSNKEEGVVEVDGDEGADDDELLSHHEVFVGPDSVVSPVRPSSASSSSSSTSSSISSSLAGPARFKPRGKRKSSSPLLADEERESTSGVTEDMTPLSVRETIVFAAQFAPLWFLANFLFNWSLSLTSVPSTTIISSTSGLFTFLIAAASRRSQFKWSILLGILIAFGGVLIIQLSDSSSDEGTGTRATASPSPASSAPMSTSVAATPPFSASTSTLSSAPATEHTRGTPHSLTGDFICLLSAAAYGLYANVLKWRIVHEDRISNPIFLGFVGLWNLLLLWPGVLILHFTGVQVLSWPSTETQISLLLNGLIGTVASDLLWLYAVLLASPLIATLGMSFTIPLAVLFAWLFQGASFNLQYVIGGILVIIGFTLSTLAENNRLPGRQCLPTRK